MKKTLWIVVVCLLSLSLLFSSCRTPYSPFKIEDKDSSESMKRIDGGNSVKPDVIISANSPVGTSEESPIDIDTIKQVADNMRIKLDTSNPKDVEAFLITYGKLSYEDRLKYGVWGESTKEREKQKMLLGLIPLVPENVTDANAIIHDNTGQGNLTDKQNKE